MPTAQPFEVVRTRTMKVASDPVTEFAVGKFGDACAIDGTNQAENFRAWFGTSKCVDDDGMPKVMFHGSTVWEARGTSLGDFDAFDRMASVERVRRRPSIDVVGSWFSSRSDAAGADLYACGGVIYPVYLMIASPWLTTFEGMTRRARAFGGIPEGAPLTLAAVDALRYWLVETGRDGIRIRHDVRSESTEFRDQDVWIALEPTQIKSAISNAGTYCRTDPGMSDPLARNAAAARAALEFLSGSARRPQQAA